MAISEDKKRIAITLSDEMLRELELAAKELGISKSALVIVALKEYLSK